MPITGAGLITAGKALGSIASGIGAVGSLFGNSGGTSVYKSAQLMKYQDKLQRKYTQWLNENQYSQLRTGLENAGYNPLLAMGASPSEGNISTANAVNGSPQTDPLSAMATLAQIENLKTNTANNKAGILGKLFGTGTMNNIKNFFQSGNSPQKAQQFAHDVMNFTKGILSSTAKGIFNNGVETGKQLNTVLKGYISNTGDYHGGYNMPPKELPSGMATYQY